MRKNACPRIRGSATRSRIVSPFLEATALYAFWAMQGPNNDIYLVRRMPESRVRKNRMRGLIREGRQESVFFTPYIATVNFRCDQFMSRFIQIFILGILSCCASHAATLEELFEQGQNNKFLPQARAKAKAGDPDALFMLGKAYALGKFVKKDLSQARIFYEQARKKGSARASHNLGALALSDGQTEEAKLLLHEALDRGLKLPTLYNLGRAYTIPTPGTRFFLLEPQTHLFHRYL